MKKLLYACLALALTFALCACDEGETTANTADDTAGTTQQPTTQATEHIHSFGEWETIAEASCAKVGLKERTCSCGEKETEEIAALGHTEVIDAAVAPSCTETGLTEGKHCDLCDEVLVIQEEVAVVAHEYSSRFCVYCGQAQPTSDGLFYQRNDDGTGFTVMGIGTCTDTDVVIPETYKELPVTAIGEDAFNSCQSLTGIDIPDSVTSIGDYAFYHCRNLTSINIPDSVTSIGWCAFSGCSSLTSINILDSVISIGSWAFSGCSSLTSINIPNSVISIGSWAFYNCSSLTSITIPDSVTSIGGSAFFYCSSLTAVYITDVAAWCGINFDAPDSNPFGHAHNLYINGEPATEIVIPDGVTGIGDYAFVGGSSLMSITIPDSVTSIGDWAFSGCSSLTTIYYNGTYEEWSAIKKDDYWISTSINYTLHCTDGDYTSYE